MYAGMKTERKEKKKKKGAGGGWGSVLFKKIETIDRIPILAETQIVVSFILL